MAKRIKTNLLGHEFTVKKPKKGKKPDLKTVKPAPAPAPVNRPKGKIVKKPAAQPKPAPKPKVKKTLAVTPFLAAAKPVGVKAPKTLKTSPLLNHGNEVRQAKERKTEHEKNAQARALGAQDLFKPGKEANITKAAVVIQKDAAKKRKATREAKYYPRSPGAKAVVKKQKIQKAKGKPKEDPGTKRMRKFSTRELRLANKEEQAATGKLVVKNEVSEKAKKDRLTLERRIARNKKIVDTWMDNPRHTQFKPPEYVKTAGQLLNEDTGVNDGRLKALKVLNAPFNLTGLTIQKVLQKGHPGVALAGAIKDVSKGKEADWKNTVGETLGANKAGKAGKVTTQVVGTGLNLTADPLNAIGIGELAVPLKTASALAKKQALNAAESAAKASIKRSGVRAIQREAERAALARGVSTTAAKKLGTKAVRKSNKHIEETQYKKLIAEGKSPKVARAVAKKRGRVAARANRAGGQAYKDVDEVANARRGHTTAPEGISKNSGHGNTPEKTPAREGKGKQEQPLVSNKPKPETEKAWKDTRKERAVAAQHKAEDEAQQAAKFLKKQGYHKDEIDAIIAQEGKNAAKKEMTRPIPYGKRTREIPLERKNPNMGERVGAPTIKTLQLRTVRAPALTLKPEGLRIKGTGVRVTSKRFDKGIALNIPGTGGRKNIAFANAVHSASGEAQRIRNRRNGRIAKLRDDAHGGGALHRNASFTARAKGATEGSASAQANARRTFHGEKETAGEQIKKSIEQIRKLAHKNDDYSKRTIGLSIKGKGSSKRIGPRQIHPEGGSKLLQDYEAGVRNEVTDSMAALADQVGHKKMRESVEAMLDPGALAMREKRVRIKSTVAKTITKAEEKVAKAEDEVKAAEKKADKAKRDRAKAQSKTATTQKRVQFEDAAQKTEDTRKFYANARVKDIRKQEVSATHGEQRARGELERTQRKAKEREDVASGARQAQPPKATVKAVEKRTGKAEVRMTKIEENVEGLKGELKALRRTPVEKKPKPTSTPKPKVKQNAVTKTPTKPKLEAEDFVDLETKNIDDSIREIYGSDVADAAIKDFAYEYTHFTKKTERWTQKAQKIEKKLEADPDNEDLLDDLGYAVGQVQNYVTRAQHFKEKLDVASAAKKAPKVKAEAPKRTLAQVHADMGKLEGEQAALDAEYKAATKRGELSDELSTYSRKKEEELRSKGQSLEDRRKKLLEQEAELGGSPLDRGEHPLERWDREGNGIAAADEARGIIRKYMDEGRFTNSSKISKADLRAVQPGKNREDLAAYLQALRKIAYHFDDPRLKDLAGVIESGARKTDSMKPIYDMGTGKVEGPRLKPETKAYETAKRKGKLEGAEAAAKKQKVRVGKATSHEKVIKDVFDRAQAVIDRNMDAAAKYRAKVPGLKKEHTRTATLRRNLTFARESGETKIRALDRSASTRKNRLAYEKGRQSEIDANLKLADNKLKSAGQKRKRAEEKVGIYSEAADDVKDMKRRNVFEPHTGEGTRDYAKRMSNDVPGKERGLAQRVRDKVNDEQEALDDAIAQMTKDGRAPKPGTPDYAAMNAVKDVLKLHAKLADDLDEFAKALKKSADDEAQRYIGRYKVKELAETPWGTRWLTRDPEEYHTRVDEDSAFGERIDKTRQQTADVRGNRARQHDVAATSQPVNPGDAMELTKPLEAMRRNLLESANRIALSRYFAAYHASGRPYKGGKLVDNYEEAFIYIPGEGMERLTDYAAIAKAQRQGKDVRILTHDELAQMQNAIRTRGWEAKGGFSRGYLNLKSGMTHLFTTLSPGAWTRNVVGDTFNQILGGTGISGIVGGWRTAAGAAYRHKRPEAAALRSGKKIKTVKNPNAGREVVPGGPREGATRRVDRRRKVGVKDTEGRTVYRTRAQLLTEAKHQGVTGGLIGGELQGTFGKSGRISRVAAGREMGPRTGSFIEHRRAMGLSDAAARTNKYHFDYQELTAAEKKLRDAAFPFFTWTARNSRLQFGEMLRHPTAYNSLLRVLDMQAREAGFDNIKDALSQMDAKDVIQMPIQFSRDFALSFALPVSTVLDLLEGMESGKREDILLALPKNIYQMGVGLLNPIGKGIIEIAGNRNLYFGGTLKKEGADKSETSKPAAPLYQGVQLFGTSITPGFDDLPAPMKKLMGIEYDYVNKRWAMAGRWKQALGYLGPQAQQLMFANTPPNSKALLPKDRKLLSSISGARIISTDQRARAKHLREKLWKEKNILIGINQHQGKMGPGGYFGDPTGKVKRQNRIAELETQIQEIDAALGEMKVKTPQQAAAEEVAKDLNPPNPMSEAKAELLKDAKEIFEETGKWPEGMTPALKELAKPKLRSHTPAERGFKTKIPSKKKPKVSTKKVIASTTPPVASASSAAPVVSVKASGGGRSASTPTPYVSSAKAAKGSGTYTASTFGGSGDPGTGVTGYRGDNLSLPKNWNTFAELSNDYQKGTGADFAAMGGLEYGTKVEVIYPNGKKQILVKRDVGAGGPGLKGKKRGIDIWHAAAKKAGFSGTGNVKVTVLTGKHKGEQLATGKMESPGSVADAATERPALKAALAQVLKDGYVDTDKLAAALRVPPEQLEPATESRSGKARVSDKVKNTGANPWVAALQAGASVSSGHRPGAITSSGNVSDHSQSQPGQMARDFVGKDMDKIAREIARTLGLKNYKGGLVEVTKGGYRYQLIWRAEGHYDHVHLGRKKV